MCLSIPMQVVALEADGDVAVVARGERRERVNMLMTGAQPVGTWVLTQLGYAREVLDDAGLALIEEALEALAASLDGEGADSDAFADLARARAS